MEVVVGTIEVGRHHGNIVGTILQVVRLLNIYKLEINFNRKGIKNYFDKSQVHNFHFVLKEAFVVVDVVDSKYTHLIN